MGSKAIWIIIALLGVVLLYIIFKGASNNDARTATAGPGPSNIPGMLEQIAQTTNPPTSRDCSKDCKTLCDVYPIKILCKDRCQCRKACESDCVKGLDYKNMHP